MIYIWSLVSLLLLLLIAGLSYGFIYFYKDRSYQDRRKGMLSGIGAILLMDAWYVFTGDFNSAIMSGSVLVPFLVVLGYMELMKNMPGERKE